MLPPLDASGAQTGEAQALVSRPGVPLDTTPEAFEVQVEAFRRMAPERRLLCSAALSRMIKELTETGIRLRHAGYQDRQVFLARVRLELGDSLFREVYPGEPLLEP